MFVSLATRNCLVLPVASLTHSCPLSPNLSATTLVTVPWNLALAVRLGVHSASLTILTFVAAGPAWWTCTVWPFFTPCSPLTFRPSNVVLPLPWNALMWPLACLISSLPPLPVAVTSTTMPWNVPVLCFCFWPALCFCWGAGFGFCGAGGLLAGGFFFL